MVFTYATFVRTGAAVHSHRSGTDAVCGSIHWRFRGLAFVKSEQSTQFNSYYSSEFCCEAKKKESIFAEDFFVSQHPLRLHRTAHNELPDPDRIKIIGLRKKD